MTRKDVIYSNRGLVPFGDGDTTPDELSFGHESRYVDHRQTHGIKGLVTLIGIRYTTARGDASTALDMLLKQLPSSPPTPATDSIPLVGGSIENFDVFAAEASKQTTSIPSAVLMQLLRNHGTEYRAVLGASADPAAMQCIAGTHTLRAEIDHAVTHEMAVRLEDVVLRRTDLGSGHHPGPDVIVDTAQRMQSLLHWTDQQREAEIEATLRGLSRHHASRRKT